jgi:hypothetical protein
VLSYPFVAKTANDTFGSPEEGVPARAVGLANPLSAELGYLRTSVLPGLLELVRRNTSRGFRDPRADGGGLVFLPEDSMGTGSIPPHGARPSEEVLDALYEGIPYQPLTIAAVYAGNEAAAAPGVTPRAWDWADAVDAVRLMGEVTGVDLVVEQGAHQAFHPGRTARISLRSGEVLGYAGELHPKLTAASDLPARTVALEINADLLFEAAPDVIVARPLSTYPASTQDVALVVAAEVPSSEVLETLRGGAGELLEDVSLFDVYAGPASTRAGKSLAFALRFRRTDRTLTAKRRAPPAAPRSPWPPRIRRRPALRHDQRCGTTAAPRQRGCTRCAVVFRRIRCVPSSPRRGEGVLSPTRHVPVVRVTRGHCGLKYVQYGNHNGCDGELLGAALFPRPLIEWGPGRFGRWRALHQMMRAPRGGPQHHDLPVGSPSHAAHIRSRPACSPSA